MRQFCQDRDLLAVEPIAFFGGGLPARRLARGSDGELSGTTFTSAAADFTAAGVSPGMVLTLYTTTPAEGTAVEVVSVDAPTTLTVSVLRASAEASAVAPPDDAGATGLAYFVNSFDAQIAHVSDTLAEKLRQMTEAAGIASGEYLDSVQLRTTTAYGVLASVFVARAANASDGDANWVKARHYRELFQASQVQLRLVVDADGDGIAEQTRTLGHVHLTRS